MPLQFEQDEIWLIDACGAEEALELVDLLSRPQRPKINLSRCSYLHAALLQTVLAYKPAISQGPTEPFLERWIVPMLAAETGSA
ncbi:MAG: hypothetical protein ABSB70_01695 [Candidatus Velthaea sp.]|jgi:hypothetical protein